MGQFWKHHNGRAYVQVKLVSTRDRLPCFNNHLHMQAHTRTEDKFSLYRQGQRWWVWVGDEVRLRSAEDSLSALPTSEDSLSALATSVDSLTTLPTSVDSLSTLPTSKDSFLSPPTTSGWERCQNSRWFTVPQVRAREGYLAVCGSIVIQPFLGDMATLATFLPVPGEWSYGRPVREPAKISTNLDT